MPYSYSGKHVLANAVLMLHLVLLVSGSSRAPPPLPQNQMLAPSPSSDDVVAYSFPAFDDRTGGAADGELVVATSSSILSPATFLFDAQLFPEFNRSQGFLLLQRKVHLWGAATDDNGPIREASFNTSFTVGGSSPAVSFVVLLDSFPPLAGSHGSINSSSRLPGGSMPNASNSFAAVEVGAVGSYGPETPDVGLNVTVTPNTSSSATVWIEYRAAVHQLLVYVAGGEETSQPMEAFLDAPLDLASRCATQSAFVGFFAAAVRDAIHDVHDWHLTADRVVDPAETDGEESGSGVSRASWLVILLAALGSVLAATAGVVILVVFYFRSRRRELEMERMMKQIKLPSPSPATRTGVGRAGET